MKEQKWALIVERVLKLAIPTLYIWLVMFYTLFHVWLNIVAEVLQFGDREFYKVSGVHWTTGLLGICSQQPMCLHVRADWDRLRGFQLIGMHSWQDWWNATTIGDYWRLWNMPVHKVQTLGK